MKQSTFMVSCSLYNIHWEIILKYAKYLYAKYLHISSHIFVQCLISNKLQSDEKLKYGGKYRTFVDIINSIERNFTRWHIFFRHSSWFKFHNLEQFFGKKSVRFFSRCKIWSQNLHPGRVKYLTKRRKKYKSMPRFFVHVFWFIMIRNCVIYFFFLRLMIVSFRFGTFAFAPVLRNFATWPPIFSSDTFVKYHYLKHDTNLK